jgi:hypothetical protein
VAGGCPIGVCADVVRQYLRAGLLDEIHISLVPDLLAAAFGFSPACRITSSASCAPRVVESDGVTYLSCRVLNR